MKNQNNQLLLVICIITIILFLSNIAYAGTTDTFDVTIKPSGLLLYNESPVDGATDVSTPTTLSISCLSLTNNTMNLTWYWKNATGSWVSFGQNLSIHNGTYTQINSNFSTELTTNYWRLNLSDGTLWIDSDFHFTTRTNISVSFTYAVNNNIITLTPTIWGATYYQWVIKNESSVVGETEWIPISDLDDYRYYLGSPGRYRITLIGRNDDSSFYDDFSMRVNVQYGSAIEIEVLDVANDTNVSEYNNPFKNVKPTVSEWFGNRNVGEILLISFIILALLVLIIKRRPRKLWYYPIKRKKK